MPDTPATPDGAKTGATLIRIDQDAQLNVDRSAGPISLEELGYEVYGGRDDGATSPLAGMRSDHGSPGGAGHGAGAIARSAAAISSVDSAGTLRGHARSEDAADHRSKTESDGRGEAARGAGRAAGGGGRLERLGARCLGWWTVEVQAEPVA